MVRFDSTSAPGRWMLDECRRNKTVLIVEDDPDNRAIYQVILQHEDIASCRR